MLLSLVVVAHRHQAWIRPFLTSVLEHAPSADVEVLVVDDASPDHTARIVTEVAAGDPRVRLHRQHTRAGTSSSWRTGLELTSGEYVWLLEAIDLLLPPGLAQVLGQLAEHPDVVLVPGVELDLFGGRQAAGNPGQGRCCGTGCCAVATSKPSRLPPEGRSAGSRGRRLRWPARHP